MENENVRDCAPVTREEDDNEPMRREGDENEAVEDAPEGAGVDHEEGEDAVATKTEAMRKHHQLTHNPFQAWCEQCVRGQALDLHIDGWKGRVREEIVIQTDHCLMKTRPQDDLITTLVGVDDSSCRCVAICVERKGARDV